MSSHGVMPASRKRRTDTVRDGINITSQNNPNSVIPAINKPDNTGLSESLYNKEIIKAITPNMHIKTKDTASIASAHVQNSLRSALPLKRK
jgi:hypothetical protein